ncbi:hypothetical protein RMSM_03410 [Rhodopirellula maiorica SM1]|uniref:Uncharacterized protein n=1 Tax=Rhodopirellula maiorica SM1 TaxID=1265738 RepID=M5RKD9_9BACT|nr:hypothetical protein RMSM_03410 [Rhodopirellula maiorica SM1]
MEIFDKLTSRFPAKIHQTPVKWPPPAVYADQTNAVSCHSGAAKQVLS